MSLSPTTGLLALEHRLLPCGSARSPVTMETETRLRTDAWRCCLALACLSGAANGHASGPDGISLAVGSTQTHTLTVGASLIWKTGWERRLDNARLQLQVELGLTSLRASTHDPAHTVSLLSMLPVVRFRPGLAQPDRSFFLEAGVGLSVFDRPFVRGDRYIPSRWNFAEVLGAGMSFGRGQSHEIGLRLTHVSNGGLRKPNPGLNGAQVRYAASF